MECYAMDEVDECIVLFWRVVDFALLSAFAIAVATLVWSLSAKPYQWAIALLLFFRGGE